MSQSQEDGALGITRCMVDADAKSGDFFGPRSVFGLRGPALPCKFTKNDNKESNKKLLWEKAEAAVGAFDISA